MVKILIEQTDKELPLPKQANKGDACVDLYSSENAVIKSGEIKLISTGIKLALPLGYEAQIRPRSGLALKNGVTILNSPGTIDAGYRGVVGAIIVNHSKNEFKITKGDRICQMAIRKIEDPEFEIVSTLPSSERGAGGFGSTGVK